MLLLTSTKVSGCLLGLKPEASHARLIWNGWCQPSGSQVGARASEELHAGRRRSGTGVACGDLGSEERVMERGVSEAPVRVSRERVIVLSRG